MKTSLKKKLWYTTMIPLGLGLGAVGLTSMSDSGWAWVTPAQANACAANPCAADPCGPCNPCAANPCAADPCGPCNPCAAACDPCAPCGPCGACGPCDPCGPCAAGAPAAATGCYVPRLQEASHNPCAACGPCDPCAAACDPCAAACNPCAANPCAADPCAANPCAANPCAAACAANPCAADPCGPCAANPCAAACGPCGPCGPCAAAELPDLTDDELQALYACLMETLGEQAEAGGTTDASWVNSDRAEGAGFIGWKNFATMPYPSFTHGGRLATNHANDIGAAAYGMYEEIGEMPAGGIVAKPTFSVDAHSGEAKLETLFLMERVETGTMPDSNDWIYTSINPDGSIWGRTDGFNSAGMDFCVACHEGMGYESDDLAFLPEELRVQ